MLSFIYIKDAAELKPLPKPPPYIIILYILALLGPKLRSISCLLDSYL